MPDWVQGCLTDTVSSLREAGLIELATDIERLLECGEIDKLRLFRSPEIEAISTAMSDVEDESDMANLLRRLVKALSLKHSTVHVVTETRQFSFSPKVVTTYPNSWINRYVDRGYARIDPIFPKASESGPGFYWDSLSRKNPMVEAFFRDAEASGVGRSGFTLPVRIWNDAKVAISVTSDLRPEDFRLSFEASRSDFEIIAEDIVLAFCEFSAQEFSNDQVPSDKMLRLLQALANGQTMREVFQQLRIADIEAESRKICEFYQARTLLQAVVKSVSLSHLDEFSLDRWQIVSESSSQKPSVQP